jgi:hypothetical protein
MTTQVPYDRSALRIWFMLVILGMVLAIVGWYRWAT